MSRGPGRWQRAILERLHTREQFYLTEILPWHKEEVPDPDAPAWLNKRVEREVFRRHEQMAAIRAAHRLAARALIAMDTRRFWTNHYHWTGERWQRLGGVIVARPGVTINCIALEVEYKLASEQEQYRSIRERQALSQPEISVSTSGVPTLKPIQLGAVASMVKLLATEGHVTDAFIIERMSGLFIPETVIMAALDQLKASGAYQRIMAE